MRLRVRAVLAAATALLAGGSVAVASDAAAVSTGPAVTTARVVLTEEGFDTASAPPTSTIRSWTGVAPFHAVNMYFSGSQRFDTAQVELSPLWVRTVLANGWEIIPTVVDLQPPKACYGGGKASMSTDPHTARQQGINAAHDAIDGTGTSQTATSFQALGIGAGAVAYLDIEPYTVPSGNTTCIPAIRAFLNGWISQLHAAGFRAGVYSRPVDAIRILVNNRNNTSYPQADAIWFARWNGVADTSSADIPSDYLPHHRIHQYLNTTVSYAGSDKYGIDRDAIGGDVVTAKNVTLPASPPYLYTASVPDGTKLHERDGPTTSATATGITYDDGVALSIDCQATAAPGDSGGTVHGDYVWDRLTDGRYVSDLYTDTTGGNGISSAIRHCDTTSPRAKAQPLPRTRLRGSVTVTYSGTDPTAGAPDDSSGVASYDVRWHRARWDGGFGSWHLAASHTTATQQTIALSPGYTYCVEVRAWDRATNRGAWSAPVCTARPLDDRGLAAATSGWSRKTGSDDYLGTATTTTGYQRTLTRSGVQARTIGLVVAACARCGKVSVHIAGARVGVVDLHSSTTHRRRVVWLPSLPGLTSGTVTIRTVSSGANVTIDGLVVSRV